MSTMIDGRLEVPGASLHYVVSGEGPTLLLIHGGTGDADTWSELARELSAAFRVIRYDRRGHSRSSLQGTQDGRWIQAHADDAHWLLEALTEAPAYVFGSSSGAVIALDLITRYPDDVRRVVAHEPPLLELLSDAEELKAMTRETIATYKRDGVEAAFAVFGPATGFTGPPDLEPGARPTPTRPENVAFWFKTELTTAPFFPPDLATLAGLAECVVLAGGEDSRAPYPYRAGTALAERIGAPFVELPGTHAGAGTHPRAFGSALSRAFT